MTPAEAKVIAAINDPDMRRCTCGGVPELHKRIGSRFGYAVLCSACSRATNWSRTEEIAWAVWNRGQALALARAAQPVKRKRKGGKR